MKLCILTEKESNLTSLLTKCFATGESEIILLSDAYGRNLDSYDALALLCGAEGKDTVLLSGLRLEVERQIRAGKRVFAEYCQLIGDLRSYSTDNSNTRYERPVLLDASRLSPCPPPRTLLDEQSNSRIHYFNIPEDAVPLAQYRSNPEGFYTLPETAELVRDPACYALFFATPTLLVSAFRLSNFATARFSPRSVWCDLLAGIVNWLGGSCTPDTVMPCFEAVYRMGSGVDSPLQAAEKSLAWMERANMLLYADGKPYAAREGLGPHIYPDGTQQRLEQPRPDCTGEVALACYMDWLCTGNAAPLEAADGLLRYVLDSQVKEGVHRGMVRWTSGSWWVCYGDDAARALLLPGLFRAWLSGDRRYLPAVRECLDYLLSTTGTDGLRFFRTDFAAEDKDSYTVMGCEQNPENRKWHYSGGPAPGHFTAAELRAIPANCPSAHYNATYLASLLLFYLVSGEERYCEAGVRGLDSLMAHYPETAREHSETQELCRLLLPLALLWRVAEPGDTRRRGWLYQVARDLNALRNRNGGFAEWDSGYIAACAGTKGGECSVLAENGDPVTDLLYSANWLPLAVNVAYLLTDDPYFDEMRRYVRDFFLKAQIASPDPAIDGIWPRSVDLERKEVYGVPNDVGWAPWSVESGWTVAEIAAGLLLDEAIGRGAVHPSVARQYE